MKTLVLALLISHVAAGTIALFIGLIPMFSKKGSPLHNRTGQVYVWCMIFVAVTAVLLFALQPFKLLRLFLTGIAVFSFYLCVTGWRVTKQKKSGPMLADKILSYVTLAVGSAMIAYGSYLLMDSVSVFATLFLIFGFLTFRNAWHDVKSFGKTPEKMHWFYHHVARMGGSYIATFTAFLVNNIYRALPESAPAWIGVIGWVAPAIIGGMLIGRTIAHYKQKFEIAKLQKSVIA